MNLKINENLESLNNWLNANKLSLNLSKTNYIIFNPHKDKNCDINPILNNNPLHKVNSLKILGIEIDNKLTWKNHIGSIKKKLASAVFIIQKIRQNLTKQIALTLYNTLFKSHLTYCISIWGNACKSHISPLMILQNKYIKSCLLLPKRTTSNLIYSQAKVLPFSELYKYHLAILVYKIIYTPNSIPESIHQLFTLVSQTHLYKTRASNTLDLFNFPCNSDLRKQVIKIQAPQIWNKLPIPLKLANSLTIFKHKLKDYYIANL